MPNGQNDKNMTSRTNTQAQPQAAQPTQGKNELSGSYSGFSGSNDLSKQEGPKLDVFLNYMKNNWKIILSELVAAGVTAYLDHNMKERASKQQQ